MSKFKFKFNKKTIILDIDETKPFRHYNKGWFSIGCYAYEDIINSPIFDDNDKKRLSTLTIYSVYKHLKKI